MKNEIKLFKKLKSRFDLANYELHKKYKKLSIKLLGTPITTFGKIKYKKQEPTPKNMGYS